MRTYTVDTVAAIRKLKDAGCAEPLAEAIVGLVAEREEVLATKADIHALKTDIHALYAELKAEMRELRAQLTIRLWIAIGTFLVLPKAWDYFFPIASSL